MFDPQMMQMGTTLIGATAVTAVIYVVLYPYISGDRARDKRLAGVTASSKRGGRGDGEPVDAAAMRRKQIQASLKEMSEKKPAQSKLSLRMQLARAGLSWEPKTFWMASAASGVICGALAMVLGGTSSYAPILTLLAAFVGAFGIPKFVLSKLITRRQKKFEAQLANAIDLVVRGIKTGLPLNECLQVIAAEIPGPVGEEFREVVEQQRVGMSLGDALFRLTERMPLQDVNFLAIVISIQQQAGGNLAEALENLSNLLRDRWKMAQRVKALASEAKASAAILGALPPGVTVMLYLSSPEYIEPLFSTRSGNLMLLAGGFWMLCGILVMRKLINFKF